MVRRKTNTWNRYNQKKQLKQKRRRNRRRRQQQQQQQQHGIGQNANRTLLQNRFDYSTIPDLVFYLTYCAVFNETADLLPSMNDDEKIQFVRHYTSLHDRLCYMQLQEDNWKSYYYIGSSQNIWQSHISKQQAKKFSICYSYGYSKSIVEQHIRQFEKHVEEAYVALYEYELEILSKATQYDECFSAMKNLFSKIYQFVQKKQKPLQYELEWKQHMLQFDITDHRLLQKFFDLKPSRSQIISAKHIWATTKQQMSYEEDVRLLEQRLTSSSSISSIQSASDLIYHMINDIDIELNRSSNNETERLQNLKKTIIEQAIKTRQSMANDLNEIIQTEKDQFFVNTQSTLEWQQKKVFDAIDKRHSHMIKSAVIAAKYKVLIAEVLQ